MLAEATKPSTERSAPYRLLDSWRGIAAFWVVMVHACIPIYSGVYPELATNPFYRFSMLGQLGVTMFFVISGFCIAAAALSSVKRPNPAKHFLIARFRRIYPPYIASTALAVAISLSATFLASHHLMSPTHMTPILGQSFKFYFAALTITQLPLHVEPIVMVYWSLCCEVAFYAIVALALFGIARKSKPAFFIVLNTLTVGTLAWMIFAPTHCPFPLKLWYQFGLGVMVFGLTSRQSEKLNKWFFIAALILAAIFATVYQGPHSPIHPSSRMATFFCMGFAVLAVVCYRYDDLAMKNPLVRAFAWLGTISYSLYLVHALFRPLLFHIGEKLHLRGNLYIISFFGQIAVEIVIAYGFHLLVEKPFLSSKAKQREAEVRLAKPEAAATEAREVSGVA